MRHRGSSVLTASKDWTVAISILRGQVWISIQQCKYCFHIVSLTLPCYTQCLHAWPTDLQGCSLELDRRLEFHEGVVKCARWRDDNTIASSGNDR